MAQRQINGKIILRNDGSSAWETANPVLSRGEIGINVGVTPYRIKIGDGTSAWSALPYFSLEKEYVEGLTTTIQDIEDGLTAANTKIDTAVETLQNQITDLQNEVAALKEAVGRFTYVQI